MRLAGRALLALALLVAVASAVETGAGKLTSKRARQIKKLKKCCNKCKKKAPPKLECKEKAVDLIFVLDGSSSVGPKNFTVAKSFINSIVDKFRVSPQGVKVALLQYSTGTRLEFNLNQHTSKQAVTNAVKNIQWILGDTHTALALRTTNKLIVKPALSQPKRSRFVIVITDGDPQDFKKVPAAVQKLVKSKVKIFAVGVGDATVPELKKLAYTGPKSNSKDVFYADNYQSAKRFVQQLVKLICDNV